MVEFKESKFYKLLQDFFINNNKETFLQMLAEFYNRTEGIINKNISQDELIKELRDLYLEFNEKGIDENIVIEKVNYFVENNVKIKDILAKLVINTNKIEDIKTKLNINTNNIENINSELDNIKNKTINYINVKDYEYLVNDGDWAPVISFCETLGKHLIFPKGEYLIKSYLTKKSNIDWVGDGRESVIKIDNSFNYVNGNNIAIKNENYNNSNNIYDTFRFVDLTFKYCITDTSKPVYFATFISTENVYVDNCFFDSSDTNLIIHITMDFKGDNQNTNIKNCTCIYNTSAPSHEGNTICFRNFSNKKSSGIKIINNTLKRLSGGDEIIWICSNVGDIENIIIRDNTIICDSDNFQTSGIYILQTDTPLEGTYNIKNITIENNTIDIKKLKYAAIKIGSGLTDVPFIEDINIRNNKINIANSDLQTSCAIQINRCNNSFARENKIKGKFWRGITNITNCENNNIDITDVDGVIVNSEYVSKNEITTNNIGLKNCTNASDNKINCKYIELSMNRFFNYKNNEITAIDNSVRVFKIPNNINDNPKLSKPVLTLDTNIFYNGLGIIDYGLQYVNLFNNLAYIEASGYAVEGEIIKTAVNNTIIKQDTTVINDSKMNLSDVNSIPYNLRLSLPLGHKILSLNDFRTYTKTNVGDSTSSWTCE